MWRDVLRVEDGEAPVFGGVDLAVSLGPALRDLGWRGAGLVVLDAALERPGAAWVDSLRAAGLAATVHPVPGGERGKTLEGLGNILQAAVGAGVARDGWLVAVGGGALSDVAGFAAAIYLRGIPWAVVPTTLLAQVDAALGGKTAIDLPAGKNLAGAFHLPRLVVVDGGWLGTLPPREWRSGFGELLKTGLLTGGDLWEAVTAAAPGWEDAAGLLPLVEPAVRHKLRVVAADPREEGVRATLNLGHTLGHAFEAWAGYGDVSHGEAVGVGLLCALRLSEETLGLPPTVRERVLQALARWGMPRDLGGAPAGALRAILRHDKKRRDGRIRWVLLRALGDPVVMPVEEALVDGILAELGASPDGGER